jgi:hypothetical protein
MNQEQEIARAKRMRLEALPVDQRSDFVMWLPKGLTLGIILRLPTSQPNRT